MSRADGLVNYPHAAFTLEATDKIDRALLFVELNLFLGPIAIEDTHLVSDHQLHHFPHAVLSNFYPFTMLMPVTERENVAEKRT